MRQRCNSGSSCTVMGAEHVQVTTVLVAGKAPDDGRPRMIVVDDPDPSRLHPA